MAEVMNAPVENEAKEETKMEKKFDIKATAKKVVTSKPFKIGAAIVGGIACAAGGAAAMKKFGGSKDSTDDYSCEEYEDEE